MFFVFSLPPCCRWETEVQSWDGTRTVLHIILGGRSGPAVFKCIYVNRSKSPALPHPSRQVSRSERPFVLELPWEPPRMLFRLKYSASRSFPLRQVSSSRRAHKGVRQSISWKETHPSPQSSPLFLIPPPPHTVPGMREHFVTTPQHIRPF